VNDYNKTITLNNNENPDNSNHSNNSYNYVAEPSQRKQQMNFDASDEENDEKLLKFMENLDYDKYVKNLEVREALYLLKNKVEKEKEKNNVVEQNEEPNKASVNNENENIYPEKLEEELQSPSLPIIENKNFVIHEKDWNEKREDPEVIKKRMAEKILKMDKVISIFILFFN